MAAPANLTPANLIQVTPFLGTGPIDRSIAFYRDLLGFAVYVASGGYAYLERDRVAIRLLQLDAGAPHPPGCAHIYIDVRDCDALFAELEPGLRALPADRLRPPADTVYGQREFSVRDPDGNLIMFGQGIGDNAGQWDYRDAD